jgi:hypothetical protein
MRRTRELTWVEGRTDVSADFFEDQPINYSHVNIPPSNNHQQTQLEGLTQTTRNKPTSHETKH